MKAEFTYVARINEQWEQETESATIEMERYGNRGWLWYTNEDATPGSTNEEGEGLWNGTQQQLGTTQYHLPAKPNKAIRILVKQHTKSQANAGCGQIEKIKITGKV